MHQSKNEFIYKYVYYLRETDLFDTLSVIEEFLHSIFFSKLGNRNKSTHILCTVIYLL